MKRIELGKVRQGFRGSPFCELVEHHLCSQKEDARIRGIRGTVEMLPGGAKSLVEPFVDRWKIRAYEKDFWQMDAAAVFDEIIEDARSILYKSGISFDDETLFNMFNIIVLSYAGSAYGQPKMRKLFGIRSGKFPWMSAISLLYPVGAVLYISTRTPASFLMVIGYGLTNLGYVMLGAGIFAGTYRIFGLTKRWKVLVGAIIALLVGIVLSNIGI